MRDENEIEGQLMKARDLASEGRTNVGGMTYEEGVDAALRWALGETDDLPIEEE